MRFCPGTALALSLAAITTLTGCGGDTGGSSYDIQATSETQALQGQSLGEFGGEGGIEPSTLYGYFTGLDLCTEPGAVGGTFVERADGKMAAAFFNLGAAPAGEDYPPVVLYKSITVTPTGENAIGFKRGDFAVETRVAPVGLDSGLPNTGEMILDSNNGVLYASCEDTAAADMNKPHYIDISGTSEYAGIVARAAEVHDLRLATLLGQMDNLELRHRAFLIDDATYLELVATSINGYSNGVVADLQASGDSALTESTEGHPPIDVAVPQLYYWLGRYDTTTITLSAFPYLNTVYNNNPADQADINIALSGLASRYNSLVARYED